jgi:hypothetical protein
VVVGAAELCSVHPSSWLNAVHSRQGTHRSGSCTLAMAFKDTGKKPCGARGGNSPNSNHPHQPQCEVSGEGGSWLDQRCQGKEPQSERTGLHAEQDFENHYKKSTLWWKF